MTPTFPSGFEWSTGVVVGPTVAQITLPAIPGVAWVIDEIHGSIKTQTGNPSGGWVGAYLTLLGLNLALVYYLEDLIVDTVTVGSADSCDASPEIAFPMGVGVSVNFSQSISQWVQTIRVKGHVI